jgi:NADH:ubiquinone oxidoreductase subunit E
METVAEEVQREPLRTFRQINEIIQGIGTERTYLIPILQAVQEELHYLPEEILAYIAMVMDIPVSTVYSVATFYAQFSLEPKGKHIVKVCDGTACHVRGSAAIKDMVRKKLGLKEDQQTTKDLAVTVETVACIGACALAPALVVDDRIYGQLTPEAAEIIVDELLKSDNNGDS